MRPFQSRRQSFFVPFRKSGPPLQDSTESMHSHIANVDAIAERKRQELWRYVYTYWLAEVPAGTRVGSQL
jgi:hypothetical protein